MLHLVTNDKGELMAFKIQQSNQHNSKAAASLLKYLQGLAFGDKDYLRKKMFDELFSQGLKLITRKRKNMNDKNNLSRFEKQMLNQIEIIVTVIGPRREHV